jgi:hypothetical protein
MSIWWQGTRCGLRSSGRQPDQGCKALLRCDGSPGCKIGAFLAAGKTTRNLRWTPWDPRGGWVWTHGSALQISGDDSGRALSPTDQSFSFPSEGLRSMWCPLCLCGWHLGRGLFGGVSCNMCHSCCCPCSRVRCSPTAPLGFFGSSCMVGCSPKSDSSAP